MSQFHEEFLKKSDIELELIADGHRGDPIGADAAIIIHERKQQAQQNARADELARHKELID
jgi:hypothetical protein